MTHPSCLQRPLFRSTATFKYASRAEHPKTMSLMSWAGPVQVDTNSDGRGLGKIQISFDISTVTAEMSRKNHDHFSMKQYPSMACMVELQVALILMNLQPLGLRAHQGWLLVTSDGPCASHLRNASSIWHHCRRKRPTKPTWVHNCRWASLRSWF